MSVELYWHIHQLAFTLEKRADEMLKQQTSIGFAQYKVLAAVARNNLAKQNVIAELLNQTEASISRQVKILERKSLLHIGTVMGNRRARELVLTEMGEFELRQAEQNIELVQQQLLAGLTAQEQVVLENLLKKNRLKES